MFLNRAHVLAGAAMLSVTAAASAAPGIWAFADWTPEGTGALPYSQGGNPDVDAFAVVVTGFDNLTDIAIAVRGLQPNTQYAVMLTRDGIPVWNDVQAINTNSFGRGFYYSLDFDEGGLSSGSPTFFIYKWDGQFDPLLPGVPDDIITPEEARAFAFPL